MLGLLLLLLGLRGLFGGGARGIHYRSGAVGLGTCVMTLEKHKKSTNSKHKHERTCNGFRL